MEKSPGPPRPTAKDIAADIRHQIVNGDLGPGDQLRAARELAKEYGVTLVKVQNAYRELSEEGLVFSQQGRGTFVIDPSQPVGDGQRGGRRSWRSRRRSARCTRRSVSSVRDLNALSRS